MCLSDPVDQDSGLILALNVVDFARTLGQFEYKARYEQLQETPRMQPGAWLFELPKFKSWLNGSNGQTVKLVWCYGKGQ